MIIALSLLVFLIFFFYNFKRRHVFTPDIDLESQK